MEIVILLPAIMDNLKCSILDLVLSGKLQYFWNILLWPLFIFMGADRGLNQPVPLRGLRAYFLGMIISRQNFI